MSQEDVEAVRRLYEAWLRGDLGLDLLHPEISMVESANLPGPVSSYGIDAVRRYMESFAKYWDEVRFEPQEFLDAGAGAVVVVARLVGKGKRSGVDVVRTWAYVLTVEDGKVRSMAATPTGRRHSRRWEGRLSLTGARTRRRGARRCVTRACRASAVRHRGARP